jgi:hypothetical protein
MIIHEDSQVWNFMPHIVLSFTTKEKQRQRREIIGNTILSYSTPVKVAWLRALVVMSSEETVAVMGNDQHLIAMQDACPPSAVKSSAPRVKCSKIVEHNSIIRCKLHCVVLGRPECEVSDISGIRRHVGS